MIKLVTWTERFDIKPDPKGKGSKRWMVWDHQHAESVLLQMTMRAAMEQAKEWNLEEEQNTPSLNLPYIRNPRAL